MHRGSDLYTSYNKGAEIKELGEANLLLNPLPRSDLPDGCQCGVADDEEEFTGIQGENIYTAQSGTLQVLADTVIQYSFGFVYPGETEAVTCLVQFDALRGSSLGLKRRSISSMDTL